MLIINRNCSLYLKFFILVMINVLTELMTNSKITIPSEIINKFKISEGDKLEIFEKDGLICLLPMITQSQRKLFTKWPKEFLNTLGSFNEDELIETDELPFIFDSMREENSTT